jgi:signal transduction histidine kinase
MRARAGAIGGELEIYSAPESGTRIVLRLPPATGANP